MTRPSATPSLLALTLVLTVFSFPPHALAQAVTEGPPTSEPAPIAAGRAAPPGTYDQRADVLAYDLEIAVSDITPWIRGRARLEVRLPAATADPLALDFTGLAVDEVTVNGAPVPARHTSGRLHVPITDTGTATVEVLYRGVPDDGLILKRNVHGRPTAFVDNWPNRARFWFPSVDHPSDKARVSFTLHAPEHWAVVANGALLAPPTPTADDVAGPAASGTRRTWRWASEVPIPTYTMVFGAAEMVVDTVGLAACEEGEAPASPRADGCVVVSTWLFAEDTADAAPSFGRAARMVDHFTDLVGPFPYEKLANVQSSTRFGGMENSSAIFYSETALAEGRNIEGTVSHEIAHQWFGDSVTEADWHHLWLSEGFATYFGAQFFEAADGAESFRERMEENRVRYLTSDVTGRPVIDPAEDDLFDLLNANNYPKGAWVLHMLRGLLGDEVFFRGIREYYRRFAGGTALTSDLRLVVEEVSGRDLRWFFDQWLREPGYPVFEVTHRWDEGAGEVEVTIRQTQPGDWPVFRVPTLVEVRYGGGRARRPVELTERSHTLRIALPSAPEQVLLDPDGWVLARRAGEELP